MKILPSNQPSKESAFDIIFFIGKHTYKYVTDKVLVNSIVPSDYYDETKIKRVYKS